MAPIEITPAGKRPVVRRIAAADFRRSSVVDSRSTECYTSKTKRRADERVRTFKASWFSKAARKSGIGDDELCRAIRQVVNGQADDLGGGVFKKRLNENRHRSIILAKGGRHWIYEYLFAKKDRDNIDDNELDAFRRLARGYASLTDQQLTRLLNDGDLKEICHDREAQVQE